MYSIDYSQSVRKETTRGCERDGVGEVKTSWASELVLGNHYWISTPSNCELMPARFHGIGRNPPPPSSYCSIGLMNRTIQLHGWSFTKPDAVWARSHMSLSASPHFILSLFYRMDPANWGSTTGFTMHLAYLLIINYKQPELNCPTFQSK